MQGMNDAPKPAHSPLPSQPPPQKNEMPGAAPNVNPTAARSKQQSLQNEWRRSNIAKLRTDLLKAIQNNDADAVSELLSQKSEVLKQLLETEDEDGNTALIKAVVEEKPQIVDAILFHATPEQLNQQRSSDGATAMHMAIYIGNFPALNALLQYDKS
jgi:ankyrin repeat protein